MARFDTPRYLKDVAALRIGKKLPDAVYLHRSAVGMLPPELLELVAKAEAITGLSSSGWDLLKLSRSKPQVSLLSYPRFFEEGFPSLDVAYTVDFLEGKSTRRAHDGNKPILHRKESFLRPDAANLSTYRVLTKQAEDAGLFENTRTIGYQRQWDELLAKKGLRVEGHRLVRAGGLSAGSANEMSGGEKEALRTFAKYERLQPSNVAMHEYRDGSDLQGTALKRLMAKGLIEKFKWRGRNTYKLTHAGAALAVELGSLPWPQGLASGTARGCKGLRVVAQEYSSSKTSRPIKAALFSSVQKKFGWKPGTTNLDIGGGRFKVTTEYLAELGVQNLVHDLYNQSQEHNDAVCEYVSSHGVDTVTNSNVLNVIKEREARSAVIEFCAAMTRQARSRVCIFATYDPKDGKAVRPTRDGWQERRPLATYEPEIAAHFKHLVRMGDIVIASNHDGAIEAFTGGVSRARSGTRR